MQLEGKIESLKSLEVEKSDLEAAVEKLQKQIMQMEETHSSDTEQLVKVYTFIWPTSLVYDMCFSSL